MNEPDVKQSMLQQGVIATHTTPEEAGKAIFNEYNKWAAVIKDGNIKSD